jgi:DNA-binding CsgD family transcriptional regulator
MMARLSVLEGQPATAVQLAAAVTALRAEARLPALPGARTQRFLDAAARLGEHAVSRHWATGLSMTSADAVRLALGEDDAGPGQAGPAQSPVVVAGHDAPAGGLTPREHEVVALLGAGLTNREIARQLFISPATAARHVANILAKLDFSSRSQVAVWASTASPASQLAPNRALTDSPS